MDSKFLIGLIICKGTKPIVKSVKVLFAKVVLKVYPFRLSRICFNKRSK